MYRIPRTPAWPGRCSQVVAVAALSATAFLAPAIPASADAPPPLSGTVSASGPHIMGERWLTERTLQLTVATDAFAAPALVEVIFPVGYNADSTKKWPVTYYTAGTTHDEMSFRTIYNGEALTASYPSIVVAPRGDSGYWSDWFNTGTAGPPEYETFVMNQLIPLIDANFRTIPDRAHRAIMGESMGGYGALMFTARHPDKFAAAASLSGAVDSNWAPGAGAITASPTLQGAAPDSIYGPRATEEVRWRGHNPTDLARNLRGVDLQLFTGNGVPDLVRESGLADSSGCATEAGVIRPESVRLHQTLLALDISHGWQDESWGCHSPAQFQYQIAQAIERFQNVFARRTTAPTVFDHTSIEPSFDIYGWKITADPQRPLEFLTLEDVSANGLTITGSGTTTITTPPLFSGAKPVFVTIDGKPTRVQPDKNGAITFSVPQGPPNQQQQYTLGATTKHSTTTVTFNR
jgi:S-formylglutathione hydrolase FrmB